MNIIQALTNGLDKRRETAAEDVANGVARIKDDWGKGSFQDCTELARALGECLTNDDTGAFDETVQHLQSGRPRALAEVLESTWWAKERRIMHIKEVEYPDLLYTERMQKIQEDVALEGLNAAQVRLMEALTAGDVLQRIMLSEDAPMKPDKLKTIIKDAAKSNETLDPHKKSLLQIFEIARAQVVQTREDDPEQKRQAIHAEVFAPPADALTADAN